jgi:DNA mismatch repair protein MutS
MAKSEAKETPLMQQYNRIKTKYPDAILLFRVGDFYETFHTDAITTANVLGIVLTKRSNGSASEMELAGFPYHALDTYLPKLVRAGYRVAICEQLEDPKLTKTIVKRGVTELITPGVALNDKILDHKTNNFLASVYSEKELWGVAFIDISTGEFFCTEGKKNYVDNLLQSFKPAEIILSKKLVKEFKETISNTFYTYPIDEWIYQPAFGRETLQKHFGTNSLKGFGIDELEAGITAAGAIIHYLGETQHPNLQHVNAISRLHQDKYVWLDKFSIRNLELISSGQGGKSLIDILDATTSPMGSRLLKRWMVLPLLDKSAIDERLEIVTYFILNNEVATQLKNYVRQIGDLERLISKVPLGKINPREVVQLKRALAALQPIKEARAKANNAVLNKLSDQINPCEILRNKIEKELLEEAPAILQKGNVIAEGVSKDLDELRYITRSGKDLILDVQKREVERTGISSLKVGFNNVFGYYLEVTNTHKDKVPTDWIRKQTLANCERYITEELKQLEEKILGAEEKIQALEEKLFHELVTYIADYIKPIQVNAGVIAKLDCLISFAEIAQRNNYVKPEINESLKIEITEGRHPVIEKLLPLGENYVANDVYLDNESEQVLIITGPNMAGKSALLRQTALICLMAQMGSFVPATKAKIGIIDKVFTRVGASDNISSGESTFMTEMNESASIMNNISERSLILLDEIGRGTSTYDGISIAWSIAEFLHNNPTAKPKTLFATHYHELNELAEKYPRIKNYHVATKEAGQKVIFLRKLVAGGTQHSFGIHVAKMAGMPKAIVDRANEILHELEQKHISNDDTQKVKKIDAKNYQLSFFQLDDPRLVKIRETIEGLDINTLTPVEALMKLNELKNIVE